MRILPLLALLTTLNCGCAQNVDQEKVSTKPSNELYQQVKFRKQAVQYHASVQIGGCAFSLLLNDVPVVQYTGEGQGTFTTSIPLNDQILQSGPQKWQLILYPAYHNGQPTATLSPNIVANITVETLQFYNEGVKALAPKITLLETPLTTDAQGVARFTDAGKKMVVYSGTFEAKVPYRLTGWLSGVDLRQENVQTLQQEVVAASQSYGRLLQSGDLSKLSAAVYLKEKEIAQAYFMTKAEVQERVERYAVGQKNPTLQVQPLQQYQLKIYGDGRLVTLERTDYPYRGESALRADYKDEAGEEYEKIYPVYFFRPRPGQPLQIIR